MNATQQEREVLLPCPFCGSSDVRITDHGKIGTGMWHRGERVFTLACYPCGAGPGGGRYEEHGRQLLIAEWNRRASLPHGGETGQGEDMAGLVKEARKIIRASTSRNLAKDWDRRATAALSAKEPK